MSKIFDARHPDEWLSEMGIYANTVLTESVRRRLQDNPPKGCWSDDLTWLGIPGAEDTISDAFLSYYAYVKCFHACRPTNVSSYFQFGLKGLDLDEQQRIFKEIYSDVSGHRLDKAIEVLDKKGYPDPGCVHLCTDDGDFIDGGGHLLIQGSEYLTCLAANLCNRDGIGEDYRLRLRDYGIPTIFEVNVPCDFISRNEIVLIVMALISEWGKCAIDSRRIPKGHITCIMLEAGLPAECIVGHQHPNKIIDPFNLRAWYFPKKTTCECCPN